MDAAVAAAFLVPGLVLGSFLNVVAARVPLHRSVVRPGSACMSCGAPIAWYDNVPLLSYVRLRGRCRSCDARIGLRYPVVEVATALLLAGCVWAFGLSGEAAVAALFCGTLVAVSVIDVEHRVVPVRIVLPVALVVLVSQTALHPSAEWALAAAGASALALVAARADPDDVGTRYAALALLLGAMLGRYVVLALLIAGAGAVVTVLARAGRPGVAWHSAGADADTGRSCRALRLSGPLAGEDRLATCDQGRSNAMDIPASFSERDGSVVVNFGILTGREATIAEVDRLARSLSQAGGDDIRIVAQRAHEYGGGVEIVVHQVTATAAGVDSDHLERLCTLWVHDCAADRHVAPL